MAILYKPVGYEADGKTVKYAFVEENNGSADIDFGSQKEDTSTNFDLDRFESLLSRLEASKGRQQRQKSVEGRRDIFSQGLASMMSNF